MPTPKKTLAELKLSGTFQQNKRRYEHLTNPVVTIQLPVGRPPAHLEAGEKAAWAELVRVAHSGLLTRSDRLILEIAAKLIVRMRMGDAKTSELNAFCLSGCFSRAHDLADLAPVFHNRLWFAEGTR
jgi:hypothetical protein